MEQEKDYSLLRQFDLEAAKRGDFVQTTGDDERGMFIAENDSEIVIDFERAGFVIYEEDILCQLRMAPLCWIEKRPVYNGDVLYSSFFHGMEECKDGIFEVTGVDSRGQFLAGKLSKNHATQFASCSWPQPKVKREGWVNIYPKITNKTIAILSNVYASKEAANCDAIPNRIACVRIEWEE